MANEIVRPAELPPRATPVASEVVPSDNGSVVGGVTWTDGVNAGRPLANQAEAEMGVNATKAMTPLTTRQAISAQASDLIDEAVSVAVGRAEIAADDAEDARDRAEGAEASAQAWAESPAPPDGPGTESAKTAADRAAFQADIAVAYAGVATAMAGDAEDAADRAELARDAAEDSVQYDYLVDDNAALNAIVGMTSGERAFVRSTEHVWRYDGAAWVDDGLAPTALKEDKLVVEKRAGEIYATALSVADQNSLFWDVQAVFEQGGFDAGGAENTSANDLRTRTVIPVKAGDVFISDAAGQWYMRLCLYDEEGEFILLSNYQATRGLPLVVLQDGYARLAVRISSTTPVTPSDIIDNRPGIRMSLSPWNRKLANPDLGVQSIPRGAVISEPRTVSDLPIVIGGVATGGMAPHTNQTRALTDFLHLGKGSVITSTDGFEFAEYVYDLDRQYITASSSWRTSLTLSADMLVRLQVRKSDNSSMVGIDRASFLSIDWVQPAIVRRSSDVAPATITPEHLTFPVPAPPSVPSSYHVVFNIGESHAAGRGEVKSTTVVPAGAAYRYVRSSETLEHMEDPTGNDPNAISGGGKGSWGPALADTIWRSTNGSSGLIFVNSGLGSSTIGGTGSLGWAATGEGWLQAVTDWNNALAQIAALHLPVSGVSALLSIGSNDAAAGTAKATFKAGVLDLYDRLKTLIGAGDHLPLGIIQTGSFANGSSAGGVLAVQEAQEELVRENASIFMTANAPRYAGAKDQFIDNVHYNQALNEDIGRAGFAFVLARGAGLYPAGLE